jgi:uncharacterized protein YbjT (DUF2867 family)
MIGQRVVTVFGGSGFIGRHLVKRLAADGWVVRVAVRDTEAAMFLMPVGDPGQVVPIGARVYDPALVQRAVHGAAAVVNLVGIMAERGRQTFERVHVEGPRTIAEACRAAGVERLVQMSALGADPDSKACYARTKALGEQAAREVFPDVTVVRPSLVVGPEDKFFNLFGQMARVSPALPLIGGGRTRFQPVYVLDVAAAIARAIADPATAGQTYALGGPRIYTFRELMELMLKEIRRRRALVAIPFEIARLQAWFLEKAPAPLLTRDQVRLLESDTVVPEGALTIADLGVEPTAIEVVLDYLHRFRPQTLQKETAVRP